MKRIFKTICWALITAFCFQDIAFAKGNAAPDPSTMVVPFESGMLRSVRKFPDSDIIINIQDAHAKLGAQESISRILDSLVRNYDLNFIFLEGASGPVDTSIVSSFPIENIRHETGEALLKEGRISAAEFYSIISDAPVRLYGAEDKGLYEENLNVFRRMIEKKPGLRKELAGFKKSLDLLSEKIDSDELREFSARKLFYQNGSVKFSDHWDTFRKKALSVGVGLKGYSGLEKLAGTLELEKAIDFEKAGRERNELMNLLASRLSGKTLEAIVLASLEYKKNVIGSGAFHLQLRQTAQSAGVDFKSFPELSKYTRYLELYESIDLVSLFDEADRFEEAIRDKLFRTADERVLDDLRRRGHILLKLLDASLSEKEYKRYKAEASLYSPERISEEIVTLASAHGVAAENYYDFAALEKARPDAERFYELAEKRNAVLLENTKKRMKAEGVHVAALVTGGFHSEGIAGLASDEKISCLVIMPKFDEKSPDRPYLTVLTRKPKEYESALRGSDLYVSAPAGFDLSKPNELNDISANAVRGLEASYLKGRKARGLPAGLKTDYLKTYGGRRLEGNLSPAELESMLGDSVERSALPTQEISADIRSNLSPTERDSWARYLAQSAREKSLAADRLPDLFQRTMLTAFSKVSKKTFTAVNAQDTRDILRLAEKYMKEGGDLEVLERSKTPFVLRDRLRESSFGARLVRAGFALPDVRPEHDQRNGEAELAGIKFFIRKITAALFVLIVVFNSAVGAQQRGQVNGKMMPGTQTPKKMRTVRGSKVLDVQELLKITDLFLKEAKEKDEKFGLGGYLEKFAGETVDLSGQLAEKGAREKILKSWKAFDENVLKPRKIKAKFEIKDEKTGSGEKIYYFRFTVYSTEVKDGLFEYLSDPKGSFQQYLNGGQGARLSVFKNTKVWMLLALMFVLALIPLISPHLGTVSRSVSKSIPAPGPAAPAVLTPSVSQVSPMTANPIPTSTKSSKPRSVPKHKASITSKPASTVLSSVVSELPAVLETLATKPSVSKTTSSGNFIHIPLPSTEGILTPASSELKAGTALVEKSEKVVPSTVKNETEEAIESLSPGLFEPPAPVLSEESLLQQLDKKEKSEEETQKSLADAAERLNHVTKKDSITLVGYVDDATLDPAVKTTVNLFSLQAALPAEFHKTFYDPKGKIESAVETNIKKPGAEILEIQKKNETRLDVLGEFHAYEVYNQALASAELFAQTAGVSPEFKIAVSQLQMGRSTAENELTRLLGGAPIPTASAAGAGGNGGSPPPLPKMTDPAMEKALTHVHVAVASIQQTAQFHYGGPRFPVLRWAHHIGRRAWPLDEIKLTAQVPLFPIPNHFITKSIDLATGIINFKRFPDQPMTYTASLKQAVNELHIAEKNYRDRISEAFNQLKENAMMLEIPRERVTTAQGLVAGPGGLPGPPPDKFRRIRALNLFSAHIVPYAEAQVAVTNLERFLRAQGIEQDQIQRVLDEAHEEAELLKRKEMQKLKESQVIHEQEISAMAEAHAIERVNGKLSLIVPKAAEANDLLSKTVPEKSFDLLTQLRDVIAWNHNLDGIESSTSAGLPPPQPSAKVSFIVSPSVMVAYTDATSANPGYVAIDNKKPTYSPFSGEIKIRFKGNGKLGALKDRADELKKVMEAGQKIFLENAGRERLESLNIQIGGLHEELGHLVEARRRLNSQDSDEDAALAFKIARLETQIVMLRRRAVRTPGAEGLPVPVSASEALAGIEMASIAEEVADIDHAQIDLLGSFQKSRHRLTDGYMYAFMSQSFGIGQLYHFGEKIVKKVFPIGEKSKKAVAGQVYARSVTKAKEALRYWIEESQKSEAMVQATKEAVQLAEANQKSAGTIGDFQILAEALRALSEANTALKLAKRHQSVVLDQLKDWAEGLSQGNSSAKDELLAILKPDKQEKATVKKNNAAAFSKYHIPGISLGLGEGWTGIGAGDSLVGQWQTAFVSGYSWENKGLQVSGLPGQFSKMPSTTENKPAVDLNISTTEEARRLAKQIANEWVKNHYDAPKIKRHFINLNSGSVNGYFSPLSLNFPKSVVGAIGKRGLAGKVTIGFGRHKAEVEHYLASGADFIEHQRALKENEAFARINQYVQRRRSIFREIAAIEEILRRAGPLSAGLMEAAIRHKELLDLLDVNTAILVNYLEKNGVATASLASTETPDGARLADKSLSVSVTEKASGARLSEAEGNRRQFLSVVAGLALGGLAQKKSLPELAAALRAEAKRVEQENPSLGNILTDFVEALIKNAGDLKDPAIRNNVLGLWATVHDRHRDYSKFEIKHENGKYYYRYDSGINYKFAWRYNPKAKGKPALTNFFYSYAPLAQYLGRLEEEQKKEQKKGARLSSLRNRNIGDAIISFIKAHFQFLITVVWVTVFPIGSASAYPLRISEINLADPPKFLSPSKRLLQNALEAQKSVELERRLLAAAREVEDKNPYFEGLLNSFAQSLVKNSRALQDPTAIKEAEDAWGKLRPKIVPFRGIWNFNFEILPNKSQKKGRDIFSYSFGFSLDSGLAKDYFSRQLRDLDSIGKFLDALFDYEEALKRALGLRIEDLTKLSERLSGGKGARLAIRSGELSAKTPWFISVKTITEYLLLPVILSALLISYRAPNTYAGIHFINKPVPAKAVINFSEPMSTTNLSVKRDSLNQPQRPVLRKANSNLLIGVFLRPQESREAFRLKFNEAFGDEARGFQLVFSDARLSRPVALEAFRKQGISTVIDFSSVFNSNAVFQLRRKLAEATLKNFTKAFPYLSALTKDSVGYLSDELLARAEQALALLAPTVSRNEIVAGELGLSIQTPILSHDVLSLAQSIDAEIAVALAMGSGVSQALEGANIKTALYLKLGGSSQNLIRAFADQRRTRYALVDPSLNADLSVLENAAAGSAPLTAVIDSKVFLKDGAGVPIANQMEQLKARLKRNVNFVLLVREKGSVEEFVLQHPEAAIFGNNILFAENVTDAKELLDVGGNILSKNSPTVALMPKSGLMTVTTETQAKPLLVVNLDESAQSTVYFLNTALNLLILGDEALVSLPGGAKIIKLANGVYLYLPPVAPLAYLDQNAKVARSVTTAA